MKRILVVGGGSAGLVTAMILKKHLRAEVDLVYSDSIGIVGVGEGSTEHFSEFLEFVGIDHVDFIRNTDATFKSGIMFTDWTKRPYLHSIDPVFASKQGQYSHVYGRQISTRSDHLTSRYLWQSEVNDWFARHKERSPVNQYHFNTFKLNSFLSRHAANPLNVKMHEDNVKDVVISPEGRIEKVIGEKNEYEADFYVDATGFQRLLIGKLGARWESYNKYLKMNSAIAFPTDDEENYNMWTLSKAMSSGWMFRIPVWGRYGNGYIYNNEYISEEDAVLEAENYLGKKIEVARRFTFDPGKVDKAWIGNCCAVGLSSSFVEPLEASSIGSSIQQAFMLMHLLVGYDDKAIRQYNMMFDDMMENIRDFIALHYITDRSDSDFWKDIKNIEIPLSLSEKLEVWRNRLPIREDFVGKSNYVLFKENHHTVVMHGLGLFDVERINDEYLYHSASVRSDADRIINEQLRFEEGITTISHKKLLRYLRKD